MKRLAICCNENDLLLNSHSPNIHKIVFKDVLWNGVTQSRHNVLESRCEVIKQNIQFCVFVTIGLKIGTHIDWTYTTCSMYHTKRNICFHGSQKYPITKQRTFFKTRHSWPHIDLIKTRIVCIRPKGRAQCIFPRSQHSYLYAYNIYIDQK